MKEKLRPYHNSLLIVASILLLVISYQLSFKKTIEAWQLNRKFKTQVTGMTLNSQPAYLERQDRILRSVIHTYQIDTVNYKNSMAMEVAEVGDKEHVRIVEVPMKSGISDNHYLVQKIVLKGDFFDLLKTLNHLHQLNRIGYIRSVSLKKLRQLDRSKTSNDLNLEIYTAIIK
ncbi:hypothetical protein [Mucilaginibacter jinjuensis]|uniref:Uncharacterized protein n=1 Tax=Mucilaginibacter jinjuensis TaxID=1176721 RepID=A0ABY7TC60_9SPHI|nr:hypothetical protein [Mucilaginibacter jinjuensis]WCT13660.1 hypothetical protein PQO05_06890 [Mucilaginibacter jinjuensis]